MQNRSAMVQKRKKHILCANVRELSLKIQCSREHQRSVPVVARGGIRRLLIPTKIQWMPKGAKSISFITATKLTLE